MSHHRHPVLDRYYAAQQTAAEERLRSPQGEQERQKRNARTLAALAARPEHIGWRAGLLVCLRHDGGLRFVRRDHANHRALYECRNCAAARWVPDAEISAANPA